MGNSFVKELWIDTGGTFTDCFLVENHKVLNTKVLSDGTLKGTITKILSKNQVVTTVNWLPVADIFEGYTFQIKEIGFETKVQFTELNKGIISVSDEIPIEALNKTFTLTAFEEPPVLGARLLTQTALKDAFPALTMKLGSTRGTNALLERKGVEPVVFVTKGFKDLLSIRNQKRKDLFALNIQKPEPFSENIIEVEERINAKGTNENPITESFFTELIKQLPRDKNIPIAICFKNSFINAENEESLAQYIIGLGYKYVSVSNRLEKKIKYLERLETTVINAYLQPIIKSYLNGIVRSLGKEATLQVMSSAGILMDYRNFEPKDSLLSGPAGGIVGAKTIANQLHYNHFLTLDMGGTSTDVSHYFQKFDYQFQTKVGDAELLSPSFAIETVAAGGGSICYFDGTSLKVGPESAGAFPGPACYDNGGPLTITDVNLLLGRISSNDFGIPISIQASENELSTVLKELPHLDRNTLLNGFLRIANERMAEAVKQISVAKGYDPKDYPLIAFGGAGGMHACDVADILTINKVIIPFHAGLLSAYGIGNSKSQFIAEKQLLITFSPSYISKGNQLIRNLQKEAEEQLIYAEGIALDELELKSCMVYARLKGQDSNLEIELKDLDFATFEALFKEAYIRLYAHWSERPIEIESVKVLVGEKEENTSFQIQQKQGKALPFAEGEAIFRVDEQTIGAEVEGPAIVLSRTSSSYIPKGWTGVFQQNLDLLIHRFEEKAVEEIENKAIRLELYTNRLTGVANIMGNLLERTAFSVNIKERLDYSCAVLDAKGNLVVNAPHIPVHLGALGYCVQSVISKFKLKEGDVIITNHPGYGGSHLPDITLIAPVFVNNECIAYLANRSHHSEIGGKTPGSMPPDAQFLYEEGVVIAPQILMDAGKVDWDNVREIFLNAEYPSRSVDENLADLNAGIASLQSGIAELKQLCLQNSASEVQFYMHEIQEQAAQYLQQELAEWKDGTYTALEKLDDGTAISISITKKESALHFDFTGTGKQHPGNLNATPAIVQSAILYVLRLLVNKPIPLNDGLLQNVSISVPKGSFLNPEFEKSPKECPAVVGGNTETSQRVVDTLLKAFGLAACSYGTMNNTLFGNAQFGYYETIGGGTGAGERFHGTDAVHQHMTNTKITDPEILEHRFPVELQEFSIRENSGGKGKWNGGSGIVRTYKFLEEVEITVLTQHRKEAPYGLNGGQNGEPGKQYILRKNGKKEDLNGIDHKKLNRDDILTIETPGGGAYGQN